MKISNWNLFLAAIFLTVFAAVLLIGIYYKNTQTGAALEQEYKEIATSLSNKLDLLIEEKKNATLTIALSLAQNSTFKEAIEKKKNIHTLLATFSEKLRENTEFKNVWIQLVDAEGIVISRSWSKSSGDSIKKARLDVAKIMNSPQVSSSISVGKHTLSFKTMIPFYDASGKYIGFLEVISHFNSIANKMKDEGAEALILVDKSYRKQISNPFTKTFIGEYYVANNNINEVLLKYVRDQGVEDVLSYKHQYAIGEKDKYLRVNYTLFGLDTKPMAYILLFKKIEDINTDLMKSRSFLIEIIMIFIVVVVGFILLLLVKKEQLNSDGPRGNIKYLIIFFAVFTALTLLLYLLLHAYKKSEQENFLKLYNTNVEKDYVIINKKFEVIAETMFETVLNKQAVLELVKRAYTKEKELARGELYELLKAEYEYFKSYDVRQLHFHLKNNESFLRFHRPQKHGDNLSGVRATVEWVNENREKIKGFEEGKIYNGFRYVFPLSDTNAQNELKHLGSVELSFSAHAIANDFTESHSAKVAFIIDKKVVDAKVFNEEKSNYSQSEFESFYYENSIKKRFEKAFKDIEIEKISPKDLELINSKIFEGKIFSVASKEGNTLFTALPFRNPVSKEVVAAIILQINNRVLQKQNELFFLIFSVGTIMILLTIILVFREFTLKLNFLNLSLKAQHILDTQESIIIITDGKKIIDVNKKCLEFFGYKSLKNFLEKQSCISELFTEDENYYHLGKVPKERNWISFLETLAHKERVVLINDSEGKGHSFTITFSKYQSSHFVLTFSDISERIKEQHLLESKVIHDKLTGAYNREFFEAKNADIAAQSHLKGMYLGIIFFDIDHFKAVNDTHGHNVGDNVLQELVKRVVESIRSSDYLIRWGGEEFIILISAKSIEEVEATAEHLRSMIEHHSFEGIEKLTASFGITLFLSHESVESAVKRADKALYISKESGRNRVTKL